MTAGTNVGIATPLKSGLKFALSATGDEPVGRLENWIQEVYDNTVCHGYIFHGEIFGDRLGRFPDGMFIRTSLVLESGLPEELKEGSVIKTRNNSYVLGKELHPSSEVLEA